MSNIHHSITELVGNTPLLELERYQKELGLEAHILAKLEYFNPAGSVKDRIALGMILAAEKEGKLSKDTTIVETTSGNTGIAVAAYSSVKGYKSRIYIMDNVSRERTQVIQAYGGTVIPFSQEKDIQETIDKTNNDFFAVLRVLEKKFAKEENVYFLNQDENTANPQSHFSGTAEEIWRDTGGAVDIFTAGVGTGGTISGNGRFFKSKNKNIRIIAIQPELSEEGITGVHPVQGVPEGQLPRNLDYSVVDQVLTARLADAIKAARTVAKTDGVLVGISSGAALWAATELARKPENKGKNIVTLFPDTGLRYLSTNLFA